MPQSIHTKRSSEVLAQLDKRGVVHGFSALHTQAQKEVVFFESAQGVWLQDTRGRRFLDAAGGLWCVNAGYGRQSIVDAAVTQMEQTGFLHSFANFSHEALVLLTEKLLSLAPTGFDRIFNGLSGSDANDTQIKLVRRYNNIRGKTQKKKIIARRHAYHGSTIGAGSLTGIPAVHRTFDLPIPGILHASAADFYRRSDDALDEEGFSQLLADELEALIESEGPDTIAAFIAEPICGSGGVLVPPKDYFKKIGQVLRKHDVLMIADEVITGFGRTGQWFASPQMDIRPDLMTISKGLTSGYFPMSGCLISKAITEALYSEHESDGAFAHGFTSCGHPVGARVALANIDILESEALPQNAAVVGNYLAEQLRERLGSYEWVGDIRGEGLLLAVEFSRDKAKRAPFGDAAKAAAFVIQSCFEEGLIVRGASGRVIAAMAPPLVLTNGEADELADRLEKAVGKFAKAAAAGTFDR